MEDVWSNGEENVDKWECRPEWVVHGLQSSFVTRCMELVGIFISQVECLNCFSIISKREMTIFTKLIRRNGTFRAVSTLGARDQTLFRVVTNECREDRVAAVPSPMAA